MSETKKEVNPCPECGGQADTKKHNYKAGPVFVTTCSDIYAPIKKSGCSMVGAGWTEEESIQDWNAFSRNVTEDEWRREYLVDPFRSRYNAMD